MNGTDLNGNAQTIRNTTNFPPAPSLDGSNTTAGGSQFVEQMGGTLTFTFAQPTQFFGAYLTGVQTSFFLDSITFNDGTSQSISLVGTGTSSSMGEIAFIGFVDAGKSITSITINAGAPGTGQDFIGVDDVSYQVPTTTPEPASLTLALIGAGLAGLAGWRRRKS
jgi:MYXO-CTERM domain-containing protein